MTTERITVLVEDPGWRRTRGLVPALKRAAQAAVKGAKLSAKSRFTILLTTDARLRELNRDFRAKDKPTNVLSFPAAPNDENYLGDIAMALGVTRDEAKAAGKRLTDHAVHLAVHGVLHLAGYDHDRPRDAKIMEPLEVKILAGLKIADPYQVKT
jgi:probable rRNA maturation factor